MDASVFGMGHPVTATPRPSSKKPPTPPDPLAAPAHLSAPARELWRAILKDYQLEPHHMATLQKALEAFDRAEQARDIIAREGLTVEGRYGTRTLAYPSNATAAPHSCKDSGNYISILRGRRRHQPEGDRPCHRRNFALSAAERSPKRNVSKPRSGRPSIARLFSVPRPGPPTPATRYASKRPTGAKWKP